MARAFISTLAFLFGWAVFLAWLANHRIAARGPFGKLLPELTALEAWIVPTAIWLAASWWSFRAPRAGRAPLSTAAVAWRSLLLGMAMLVGAFLVWILLSFARSALS